MPGRRTGERLILAHLSNPRLGLRLFPREERGVNLRERDLSRALRAATRETIRLQPDLVLVTGDVFDGPHPTPGAITALGSSLEALLRGLPGVPVFLVAGVRDTPLRPAEPGPLEIFASLPGVSVAGATARAQFFDDTGLNVLLLPHRSVLHSPFPAIRPREEARWNVLAVQGEPGPGPGPEVDPSQWDYMAVGLGSHIREWSPGVLQAGALARTDPEPWWRTGDPEPGFVTFDLDSGEHQFHPLPDRTVVHLTVMPAGPSTTPGAPDLARTLEDVPGGPDGKILHLSIPGRRPAENHLDVHRSLAQVRARAAHLQISWNDGRSGKRPSTEAMPAEPDLSSVRAERLIRRGEVGGERSDLELPAGVCALVARDPPVRRELLRVLSFGLAPLDHGPRGAPSLGTTLEVMWKGGMGPNTELVHSLEPVHWVGMETLPDELFLRLSRQLGTEGGDRVTHADGGEGFRAGVEFDEPQSRRSQRRGAEMESLRAEALELEGDLDVRTMEWLRERQDAETQLLTYRDRARELKPRLQALRIRGPDLPCPTCGVTLGDRYPEVLSALEEEWERLVQDGRWWKRRREQLEWKPPDLRTMETKALELQAEIRSGAQTSPESDSGHENRGAVQEEDGSSHEMGALLLAQAEEFLSRLTAGRLGGLQRRKERLEVVEGGSTFGPVDSEDHVVLLLSLELAFHELSRGPVDRVLILAGLLDLLPEETCRRALHLLNQTHGHAGQLLVVSNGSVPERFPADFRLIAEVLPHPGEGRPAFRQLSWGPAGVVL